MLLVNYVITLFNRDSVSTYVTLLWWHDSVGVILMSVTCTCIFIVPFYYKRITTVIKSKNTHGVLQYAWAKYAFCKKKKKQLNMHGAMKKKKMNKMNMVHDFCAVGGLTGVWISW